MTVTAIQLAKQPGKPLLVLGPSLGTSVQTLWSGVVSELAADFDIVGWDLPGHGPNTSAFVEPLQIADLARAVIEVIDGLGGNTVFHYAGDSIGGAVGLQLLADHPSRIASAVLLCTGATIGTAEGWSERADLARVSGTAALVDSAPQRWFGSGFVKRSPALAARLLDELSGVSDAGYRAVCGALARFDIRDSLVDITTPVLAVAGAEDTVTPVDGLEAIATQVRHGCLEVLPGVAHLAPAEAPHRVAQLIRQHIAATGAEIRTVAHVRDAGMRIRRQVLGHRHVDHATAAITDFTRDFQQFITEYAWGGIWTRPGLDRRARSLITLTALVARGHHDELAMHVRAARTNGLTVDEIKELLLQTAVYCGVPEANNAFRIAQATLREIGDL